MVNLDLIIKCRPVKEGRKKGNITDEIDDDDDDKEEDDDDFYK